MVGKNHIVDSDKKAMLTSLTSDVNVDVLIVGSGPAGSTLALHLATLGISPLVISRHRGTANTPRAHIFNQRAMEVLRDAQIEKELSKVASDTRHMMHTSWLHSLNGEEYGRLYAWGNRPERKGDYELASPCVMSDLPQSLLEPILVAEAEKRGAEYRFSHEFVQQQTMADGHIKTTVYDRIRESTFAVTSRYLIGADGARSAVLDSLDIPIDGKQLNSAFNVHIRAEMNRYFAHRPGSLNWILNPEAPDWSAVGNFRMVRPWNEFVVSMHPAHRDGQPFEPTTDDILRRLHQMIGDDSVPIEILSSFRWTINDQVARTWQKGNVLCLGDATHRHPPINGLGSNTCISDAFNLAWKLAFVLRGLASPAILDSLTLERKPVGDGIVRRANEGMEAHRTLWSVIGLSQTEREASTALMSQATSEGAAKRKQFREALEATDDELQALGIQMNQVYTGSPLTVIEPEDSPPDFRHLNAIKDLMVTTYPGYHLPHVWLARDGQSHRISTLDLSGRGAFTLFTGLGGEGWKQAAQDITAGDTGLQVRGHSIGFRQDFMDLYRDWIKVRGVEEDGVVLVRPDHFIAWRCRSMVADPRCRLETVLSRILGKGLQAA